MNSDVDVTVSVMQKFHERNTVDFLVEVLQYGAQMDTIWPSDHSPQKSNFGYSYQAQNLGPEEAEGRMREIDGIYGPACLKSCVVGGEKSFNENKRIVTMPQRTYFRVWLM